MNTRNIQYMLEVIGQKAQPTGSDAVRFLTEALKEFASPSGVDRLTCTPQDATGLSALFNGLLRLAAANSAAFSAGAQRQRLDGFVRQAQQTETSLSEIQNLAAEADAEGSRLDALLARLEPERAGLLERRKENERKRARIEELEDGRLDQAAAEAAEIDRRCQELEELSKTREETLASVRSRKKALDDEIARYKAEEDALLQQEASLTKTLADRKSAMEQAGERASRAKEQLDAFEASRTELERAQQEIAARTEAFRKAWENLWDRNEAERAQVLARLQARLPEKSAYKGEKDLPAAVKGDLEQIAGWLALVQEEIQLGVTASEEMLERSANS